MNNYERDLSLLESKGISLKEIIGEGSYAVVRKATSVNHEDPVAVKIIAKAKAPGDFVKKFLPREMMIIKEISHQNIITFMDSIDLPDRAYIIMELAIHGDLLDYIRKVNAVSEKRACRWFHHLLDGIAYCHEKGIYHRDVKCENLLLAKHYVLKITDFGFARTKTATSNDEEEGGKILSKTFCGSYAYAPPEILKGKPYNMPMADIWSMGVVLFTMTAGRLPFNDENRRKLLEMVQKPVLYSRKRPPSDELKDLLNQIFKSPGERIYFDGIRRHSWYTDRFEPDWDEPVQEDTETESSSDDLKSTSPLVRSESKTTVVDTQSDPNKNEK